ncbi:hypothetical protein GCM10022409_19030 [Hymenobacter glaciei]|uniref:Carboxypeptidase regulatory-like domain-containing protein n=1 Tax=Hymenobacter glaciei TaxID=877209 RepID=A0ABP7U2M7_9BACT
MRHRSFLHLATALLGIVFVLFSSACAKKDDVAPAPATTGQLAGTLSPVGSASAVTATAADGRTQSAVPDAITGAFAFTALAPGAYQLRATPVVGFNQPDALLLTVTAGTTTTGNFRLVRDGRIHGTMTWEQNGTTYSAATFYGDITQSFFSLEGNTPFDQAGRSQNVNFVLPFAVRGNATPFTGAGTYPVGTAEYPWAGCQFYTRNGPFDQYTTAYAGRQVGQVVVTRYDLVARVATGTFSYVTFLNLSNSGTPTPDQTITNGRFDITF